MSTAAKSTILFRSTPNESAAVLSNSSWARKLDFGTSWNSLRVGIRGYYRHVTASPNNVSISGTGPTNSPQFGIGLCSGSPARENSATHWSGIITTGGTWLEQDQGAQNYTVQFSGFAPSKKVGAVTTIGSAFAQAVMLGAGALHATSFLRSLIFVDIIKGSPNYSFKLFCDTNPGASGDKTRATFLTQMETQPPSLPGYIYSSAITLAVDESVDGVFDSINIFYSRTGPEIELCDVALARLT